MSSAFITVAPNGARRSTADHPATPLEPQELARCAVACRDAGAAVMHMHVRDAASRHSLDPALYRDAIARVRSAVEDSMIIQVSTEAAGQYEPHEQMGCIRAVKPESASISIRELCPPGQPIEAYTEFLHECAECGVWLQHIFYSPAEILKFARLQRTGALPVGILSALAVIGDYHGLRPTNQDALLAFSSAAAQIENCIWTACAFGQSEAEVLLRAVKLGWSLRTGFENTLHLSGGRIACDNAELVRQYAVALRQLDCVIMDANQVRAIFNLQPGS